MAKNDYEDDYVEAVEYSNEQATFGDRLAAARETIGYSPAQLAKRLGVKKATIINWEDDRSEPRANRLQMLSGILNVSLVWLMTGEGEGVAQPDEAEEAADVDELLRELAEIRAEQRRLAERTGRIEKRLRAYLIQ